VLGTVLVGAIAGLTAALIGFFAAVTSVVRLVLATMLRIVSLPFRCLGMQQPPSPLGIAEIEAWLIIDVPGTGGVVNGQIHYTRDASEALGHPPPYHSDESAVSNS
jgi:hypothetical protein